MASFGTAYTFGFAGLVCVVCSVAIAGVSMSLRERQLQNQERDLHASILAALGLPEDGSEPEGEAIDRLWAERVEQRFLTPQGQPAGPELDQDGDGDLDNADVELAVDEAGRERVPEVLGVYVRKDGDQVGALALPVHGAGLWGPLSGYLAVDPSGTTVIGASFFGPKETPGLGAEIQEAPFQDQWNGKKLVDAGGRSAPIRVVKGKSADLCAERPDNCVDGVSGATITSRGVDEMVARALVWYDPYLTRLRGGAR